MPGSLTHTYICYRALKSLSNDSYEPFARLARSHEAALVNALANKPKELFSDTAGVLAGCAYIGSCGPDLFYIEFDREGEFIANLLHYNRSGPFIVRWLADLRGFASSLRLGLQTSRERQLAYCLGHISHIAADITIHPYVNSIVGAYPENQKIFKNARGALFWKTPWKFHNILEHYQDAYIQYDRFIGEEGFGSDADCLNLGAPAGVYLRAQKPEEWLGFVERTKKFYQYTATLDIEQYKYDFFANENTVVNVKGYYSDVIPDEAMMRAVPKLTQGKTSGGAGLFDQYVEDAVALTLRMWAEVKAFIDVPKALPPAHPSQPYRLSRDELRAFPLLGQHWNLDCGMAPTVSATSGNDAIASAPDSALALVGGLELSTATMVSRGDFV